MHSIRRSRIIVASLIAATALASACNPNKGIDPVTDPANEIPFGTVDAPVNGAVVDPAVRIVGWAVDDRGVREIRIYVDGHFQTAVPLTFDRTDVSKALPIYAKRGDRHGWATGILLDPPGEHTIIAQAVDTDGATRDIGVVKVTTKPQ